MWPRAVEYGNLSKEAMNRWTPDRPDTDIPSFTRTLNRKLVTSSFILEDASFIRLREITLSYKINFKTNPYIKGLQVYVTGSNLAYFSHYKGLNPDVIGMDGESPYPVPRTFTTGININF
jgi:hypothetical protein